MLDALKTINNTGTECLGLAFGVCIRGLHLWLEDYCKELGIWSWKFIVQS